MGKRAMSENAEKRASEASGVRTAAASLASRLKTTLVSSGQRIRTAWWSGWESLAAPKANKVRKENGEQSDSKEKRATRVNQARKASVEKEAIRDSTVKTPRSTTN